MTSQHETERPEDDASEASPPPWRYGASWAIDVAVGIGLAVLAQLLGIRLITDASDTALVLRLLEGAVPFMVGFTGVGALAFARPGDRRGQTLGMQAVGIRVIWVGGMHAPGSGRRLGIGSFRQGLAGFDAVENGLYGPERMWDGDPETAAGFGLVDLGHGFVPASTMAALSFGASRAWGMRRFRRWASGTRVVLDARAAGSVAAELRAHPATGRKPSTARRPMSSPARVVASDHSVGPPGWVAPAPAPEPSDAAPSRAEGRNPVQVERLPLTPVGPRYWAAAALDLAIAGAASAAILLLLGSLTDMQVDGARILSLALPLAAPICGYAFARGGIRRGQTFGMQALGLRVVWTAPSMSPTEALRTPAPMLLPRGPRIPTGTSSWNGSAETAAAFGLTRMPQGFVPERHAALFIAGMIHPLTVSGTAQITRGTRLVRDVGSPSAAEALAPPGTRAR